MSRRGGEITEARAAISIHVHGTNVERNDSSVRRHYDCAKQGADMLLQDKAAIIYGIGSIGRVVARTFAAEGAQVFLAGRTQEKLDQAAKDIPGAQADTVDAFDQDAVSAHADAVVAKAGRIDIAINTVGVPHVQGVPLQQLTLDEFMTPIIGHAKTNFITASAVAHHMTAHGSGVILTMSTPGARLTGPGFLGHGVANAGVETFSRLLAAELGPSGVRVVCIRPHAIPEAVPTSHTGEVFTRMAEAQGITVDAVLNTFAAGTLLNRLPTLVDVANYAAFAASDRAGILTGTIGNLTAGTLAD
jgi:NAD(P)-dependent dehydrogenase (short-subunit alcohol dehydrogenase family)